MLGEWKSRGSRPEVQRETREAPVAEKSRSERRGGSWVCVWVLGARAPAENRWQRGEQWELVSAWWAPTARELWIEKSITGLTVSDNT